MYDFGIGGSDFIEFYNGSNKIFVLKNCYFVLMSGDIVGNIWIIFYDLFFVLDDYFVFSNDINWVKG